MLRAIIVDDEQIGIDSLKLLIEQFAEDVKIVAETTEAESAINLIDDYRPEVVFLDINMPFLNGFELLQKLSFKDFNLIFTTAHEQYALLAIKNNALDYLLKPVSVDDLTIALNKVRTAYSEHKELPDLSKILPQLALELKPKLSISTKDGIEFIVMENIMRLESDSNYTIFKLNNGRQYTTSKTLKEFEKLLCNDNSNFMRINASNIINLNYVKTFINEKHGTVITSDNAELSLSKQTKDKFLSWFSDLVNSPSKRNISE